MQKDNLPEKEDTVGSPQSSKEKNVDSTIITAKDKGTDSAKIVKKAKIDNAKFIYKTKEENKSKHVKAADDEDTSGIVSEFSSLEDDDTEPAKKKSKRRQSSTSLKRDSSTNAKKDSTESRLKRLKALVIECGTRKVWKNLFEEAKCPDAQGLTEEEKRTTKKAQLVVVERALREIGMVRIAPVVVTLRGNIY